MNVTWKRAGALTLVLGVLAACASVDGYLNPDPVHGGECHDGNQLDHLCRSPFQADAGPWCCLAEEQCGNYTGQCWVNEPSPEWKARDAGDGG